MPQAVSPYRVLAVICLAALALPLSFTGGAVATPLMSQSLAASPTQLAWITNAFMLSFGSLLMAAGTLADRYGRKRLFMLGTVLFALASLLISLVETVVVLDLLRAVQGAAAAAALAGGSAALAQAFDGPARLRAFSALGTTFGVGLALGPLVAGALSERWGWQAIFLSTAAIGGVACALAQGTLRESRDPAAHKLDLPGLLMFSATLACFTCAVILGPAYGWWSTPIIALFVATLIAAALLVAIERRAAQPMLSLELLAYPRFVGVQLLPIGTCYCYIVLIVLLPIRLIGVEGASAWQAGGVMLALSAPMLVVPLLAASLTRWLSAGTLCASGFVIAAAGLYALSLAPSPHSWAGLGALLVIGGGTALPWGLMDGLAISLVPTHRAGMAAGLFNTTRVAGEGVALAITMAILVALTRHGLQLHVPQVQSPEQATLIAQRLVTGDSSALGTLPVQAVRQAAGAAFALLLQWLAGFTLLTALVVAGFLRVAPQAASGSEGSVATTVNGGQAGGALSCPQPDDNRWTTE